MKNLPFLILLLIVASLSIKAQNPYIKNTILGLKFHTYKTSDLGIQNTKNVVEMTEKKYTTKYDEDGFKLSHIRTSKIKKDKIINHHSKSSYFTSEYNFTYSKNYKTLLKQIYVKSNDNYEDVTFKVDKKNRVIALETYLKKSNSRTKKYYDYNDSEKIINEYQLADNGKKYSIINYKTDKNGNIIYKNSEQTLYTPYDKIVEYTYANNQLIKITKYDDLKDPLKKEDSRATSTFTYNEKGLIIEDKGDLTESDFNFKHHYIYEYVYDKYGNWIAKYKFKTMYGYENLKDKNYKGIREVSLRKFTYKKETTGTTDIQVTKVQNYLEQVLKNNPFKTKKAPKNGDYWFRNSERAVKLYHNGDYIGSQCNLLIILKNDFYANDSINNTMYKLKGFKLKPMKDAFYKANIFASNDDVVWFRSNEKAIKSYKNGTQLVDKLNYHKIYGNQFYINDSTTNNFYHLKDFGLEEIQGKFSKAIKIGAHNDVMWIKLESGNYTIVKNGKNITKQTKMVYAKNGIDVSGQTH